MIISPFSLPVAISMIIWSGVNSIPQEIDNFIFNNAFSVSLSSEIFTVCTFALLVCFLPVAFESLELFSKLGIYHPLSKFNSSFGETLAKKFIKVYILEVQLSLLIFIVIFFFIATIIQFKEPITNTDIYNIGFSFVVIGPAFLLSLRLLANPVKKIPRWPRPITFLNWVFPFAYLTRPNDNFQTIRPIKERFLSIYFSLIVSVLFTLIFLYVYFVTIYKDKFFNIVSNFFVPSISSLDPFVSLKLVIVFFIVLFFTTTIGELFLKKYEVMEINYCIIESSLWINRLNLLFKWMHIPIELS